MEDEVRAALSDPIKQFERGPISVGARDSERVSAPSFIVEDGNYLSARWPGDAYAFSRRFIAKLESV